ncbi:MAG: hypothetical protein WC549_05435 [Actinomycetota bacterium]
MRKFLIEETSVIKKSTVIILNAIQQNEIQKETLDNTDVTL